MQFCAPGGPDALAVIDVPLPEPAAGEVRVRAHAIGAGKPDALMRAGTYAWMPPLPATPGNDLAGVVDAASAGVTRLRTGMRVLVSSRELAQRGGCYAEAICVPADAPFVLPDAIAFDDALTLGNVQLALALFACIGADARAVLITGAAGGAGAALAAVARARGVFAIGTASSEAKRALVLESGAAHAIPSDASMLAERVRALTGGRGVDAVFDHLGGAAFGAALDALATFGTLVSYNIAGGAPECDVFAELRRLRERSLAVRVFSIHALDADRARRRELMDEAIALMAAGRVRAPRSVHFALHDVRRVHELLDGGEQLGKIVMYP